MHRDRLAPSSSPSGGRERELPPGGSRFPFRRPWAALAATAALLATAPAAARAGGPASLDALLRAAREEKLALDPHWLRLGHYRPLLRGGYESEADGPAFFLAPGGKTDPAAELEATLRGFFAPVPAAEDDHPQCRFPARRAWLVRRLGVAPGTLPERSCPRLSAFVDRVRARSVTLVFSSYYLDNPASAFGHTFLRLNKSEAPLTGKRYELLDFGVDYSATVDTHNAILYAVKGLTGLFKGEFHHYPYFYKVREYADYESRDLWEYDLALDQEEVDLLVAHLWELGGTWFDYYYLTENCSYHVLGALEALDPKLDLLSRLGPVVIPADTVKALYRNPGLVRAVHFRPSIRTQFLARASRLDGAERDAVAALADRPGAPLPGLSRESQARALDAALDWVDFVDAKDLLDAKETPAADLKQALLSRRAALGVQSEDLVVPAPESQRPDLGHGSMRAGAGAGATSDRGPVVVLDFRLALHDLGDPPEGYPALSQIEFLPTRLRYEPRSNALRVEQALLVDVVSLNDFGRFDPHPSWRASVGATTIRDGGCNACLAGMVEFGGGVAKTAGSWLTAFLLADAELLAAPDLRGAFGSAARIGAGPAGGLRLRVWEPFTVLASGGLYFLPWAIPHATYDALAQARLAVGRVALWAEFRAMPAERLGLLGASLYY